MQLPAVNIAVIQPPGYLHSLGFLDQARYIRHQFRRLGAQVTIAKNRLAAGAVNFVLGAHLGLPAEWHRRHTCIFVNLEQLGNGGAQLPPEYIDLLGRSAVVDYDVGNVAVYARDPADVPLIPFQYAPYLDDRSVPAIEERPIDLLFFGSMNTRRAEFVRRIEACGTQVSFFDQPLYGPERDQFVRQAKAVLNCHFYETGRFEQARAFQCLSLGTPVISERMPSAPAPGVYEEALFWVDEQSIDRFFRGEFSTASFANQARSKLAAFRRSDPIEAYADLLAFAAGFEHGVMRGRATEAWRPREMNLGSGKDYKPGWLNVDVLERTQPDIVLDLSAPLELPVLLPGCRGGQVQLGRDCLDQVHASNVLEHVRDLPALMTNLLALLKEHGLLSIEVPYERSPTAWQVPTHVRAMNEHSWIYYTEWFWYLGWVEHRFEMVESKWLDMQLRPCEQASAAFMSLTLRKVATTPGERNLARTMQPDFGGIDEDLSPRSDEPTETQPDNAAAIAVTAVPGPMIDPHGRIVPARPAAMHCPTTAVR